MSYTPRCDRQEESRMGRYCAYGGEHGTSGVWHAGPPPSWPYYGHVVFSCCRSDTRGISHLSFVDRILKKGLSCGQHPDQIHHACRDPVDAGHLPELLTPTSFYEPQISRMPADSCLAITTETVPPQGTGI